MEDSQGQEWNGKDRHYKAYLPDGSHLEVWFDEAKDTSRYIYWLDGDNAQICLWPGSGYPPENESEKPMFDQIGRLTRSVAQASTLPCLSKGTTMLLEMLSKAEKAS